MDVESPSLPKFPSTEASHFWVLLLTLGDVDFRLLRTYNLPLCPVVGGSPIPPIRIGPLSWGDLTATSQSPGVVPSLSILITCPGAWITHTLLRAASVMPSFVVGVASVWGVPPQVATLLSIRGSIFVAMIRTVRLLNSFCCKYLLLVYVTFLLFMSLVWVATFGSLAGLPFASFTFAESDS